MDSNLLKAAVKGHIRPFKRKSQHLEKIVNDESKDTILHVHIKSSKTPSIEFVKQVLDMCPSLLQQVNDEGDTPLHFAIKYGHSDVAKVLLSRARNQHEKANSMERANGKMLKMTNKDGDTPFDVAMQYGNIEVLKILIKKADTDHLHVAKIIDKIIYLAAERGDHEMLDALAICLKGIAPLHAALKGFNIPGTDANDTILHFHIKLISLPPSIEFVRKILDTCPSLLLQVNVQGDTPLHIAAKCGNSEIVEVLIEFARDRIFEQHKGLGADFQMLRLMNNEGNTALYEAVRHNKIDVVEILIKGRDTDFSYFANNINRILNLIAQRGDHTILDTLAKCLTGMLPLNAALKDFKSTSNDTILHFHIKSSWRPSIEFVKKIIDICPSILLQVNIKGDTPLHVAAKYGNSNIVKFVLNLARDQIGELDRGLRADLEMLRSTNNDGNTALHEAVRHGKIDVVEILTKEANSDFSYSPNKASETPLYLAIAKGDCTMVDVILQHCQLLDHQGPNGMTTLHAAVMNSNIPGDSSSCMMREIFKKKKNLTKAIDKYGWTPLHCAAYHGLKDKVSLLLEFDKSVAYMYDKDCKMTALHMAAAQGYKDIIEIIISQSVECYEMVDDKGWNVLHFAMLSLSKEELTDLLKNALVRSLINSKDVNGNTPLHICAAAYRDSFFNVGDRQAVNDQNISVEDMLKHGSHKLEEEIQILFEDVGNGQYQKGIIRKRKDEGYSKIRDERRKRYYRLKKMKSLYLLVARILAIASFIVACTILGGFHSERGLEQSITILSRNFMRLSLYAGFFHFIMSLQKFQRHHSLLSTLALWLTMLAIGAVVMSYMQW